MPEEVQRGVRLRDRRGLPRADRRPPGGAQGGLRPLRALIAPAAAGAAATVAHGHAGPARRGRRSRRPGPRGHGVVPGRRARCRAGASGSRWPAAWPWPGWPSGAGARLGYRRQHRRHARDRGHHRPGPLRGAVHPGRHRAAARDGSRPAGCEPCCQILACAAIRLLHNTAGHGLLHLGDRRRPRRLRRHLRRARRAASGSTLGDRGTLLLTAIGLLVWGAFASVVQVSVYRRGLRDWPAARAGRAGRRPRPAVDERASPSPAAASTRARWPWPPRSRFGLLLASTAWPLLAAVALWLASPGPLAAPTASRWPPAWRFTADRWPAARCCSRSAAAWASTRRCAAPPGPRCWCWWPPGCGRRRGPTGCARSRGGRWAGCGALPAMLEAADVLDGIGSEGRLVAAGARSGATLGAVEDAPAAAARRRAWRGW